MKHAWKIGALALAMMVLSSCAYYAKATDAEQSGGAKPWWCNPTEEIPVTDGPAAGSVDYYAGMHKAPLSWAQCKSLSVLFDHARSYALQWPTAGAATAAGFRMATPYVPGMGTHHILGGITPEMLADPSFNRLNPILDSAGLDATFNPLRPEVLQYDGNGPDAKLVGFDYYVRTDTGQPPAGFDGNNDWWHIHPMICFRTTDAYMVAFNASDASCTAQNGINVNMANYYMLHVWILDDMTFEPDVYAGMIPCIAGGTAIHDPNDHCHTMRGDMAAMGM
jgi:hypothetical protein